MRTLRPFAVLLFLAAAGVALYLLIEVTLAGRLPAFCGGGSGCAEVLTSRYAKVLGVPVSLPALLAYAGAAAGIWWSASETPHKPAARLAAACGAVLLGSVAWFIAAQGLLLGHWCKWCLAAHGAGLALGILALVAGVHALGKQAAAPVAAGLLCVCAVAGIQAATPAPKGPAPILASLPTDRDADETKDGHRLLGLGNGILRVAADAEPHAGPADGQPLALLFDYGCPRCRATHAVARQFAKERTAQNKPLLLVGLPVSIWHEDNPAIGATEEHFRHSAELARIVLAAAKAKPECWDTLDEWMFADDAHFPRTPQEARAKAAELAGADALAAAEKDPAVADALARNIAALTAWKKADERIQGIPVLASPGKPILAGRVNDPQEIAEMLEAKGK